MSIKRNHRVEAYNFSCFFFQAKIVMMGKSKLSSAPSTFLTVSFRSLRLCSHQTGLIFGSVRKSILYNVNHARGIRNRTELVKSGVELFTSYRIICSGSVIFVSKERDKKIPFQNGADPLNSPFAQCEGRVAKSYPIRNVSLSESERSSS